MKFNSGKVSEIQIAYIGGGSMYWAKNLIADLALDDQLSGTIRLYDLDYDKAKNNEKLGNSVSDYAEAKSKWTYKAYPTLQEALSGCDFVFISILPGTFHEMASDVHEPEKYGIYQAVGDTTGPGGLVRALRTIPMYVEIAQAIERFSPDAWVFNYTNPMTLCTRTLYEVFPNIKALGCCHEIFGTQGLLIRMLRDMEGLEGVHRDDVKVNVLGINHFTWIDQATYQQTDLLPMYRKFVDKYYESGFEHNKDAWMTNTYTAANRVKFDLFRRYGIIAAAGDRHLAEFMPPWYMKDPETVRFWKFGLTTVKSRVEKHVATELYYGKLLNGEEKLPLKASGEEEVRQLKGLIGLQPFVTNVNVPNVGQMKGIPLGAVVETNAVFSANSLRPVYAGELPLSVNNLVLQHTVNQELILKAALQKDKALAFNAFVNDPLVNIDVNQAEALFDQMLENTKAYLPGWNI
ncbi:alpha-glucosidase/alpha-galactosidase [Paenibacillus aceris]|uniref:Alpha-galactosidase n=1 Tax=Paenibacillus aceris TaxID=869555 RepID=A0ABS4HUV7_9BACL|nr:alpha-glucosidase/alpha-galactosidase [Paenibacillus aceris]MBP1962340.1 alpha-galactosidase [Paenibacillus aceris]NHW37160.1 alpha-glucosidase/alpha-galactosidase [Paenibacillus aceris]